MKLQTLTIKTVTVIENSVFIIPINIFHSSIIYVYLYILSFYIYVHIFSHPYLESVLSDIGPACHVCKHETIINCTSIVSCMVIATFY